MADEPHPSAQTLIDMAGTIPVPPSDGLSPESARDRLDGLVEDLPVEDVAEIHDYDIPGPDRTDRTIPVRLYEPDAQPPYPMLVYFHGGGFTVGSLDSHENICAALTNRADCLTISVDYRLAPEHPFPAAIDDAYAALQWVDEFADQLNGDRERIAVAGDSAGGTISAASALLVRDQGGPDLVHQGLIYPGTAAHGIHEFDSYEENAEGYFLEMDTIEWYYDNYLPSPAQARNAYAAPLLANDLSELPPATVITAGFDPIRDEGIAYADRLEEADVEVSHVHYEDMIHAFVSLYEMIPRGEEALDELGDELSAAFSG
jgi:acetyl esterase